jgi:hypothetical protein
MATKPAERSARVRADDAVNGEVTVPLEAHDRATRSRPGVAVDRPAVEPVRLESDLQRGHAGAPRRIGPGRKPQGRGEDDQTEERPERHGTLRIRRESGVPSLSMCLANAPSPGDEHTDCDERRFGQRE